jgi:glycosyltransferase involved in cell wall biosynthesis
MTNKPKITHITSVHPRYDTRIFLKQCRSLANLGHDVSLVVADGKGDEIKDSVKICDVGPSNGRLGRMTRTVNRVLAKARELDASIYHLHDPELIPMGLKLKKMGKKVIFDSHEDVPKQLLGKPYLNKPAKIALAKAVALFEAYACRRLDAVVAATPYIRDKFLKINPCTTDINNFPMLGELANTQSDWTRKQNQVCYVGGIGIIRGIREMVRAMEFVTTDVRLQLGGRFSEKSVGLEVREYPGWHTVDELGWLGREEVRSVLQRSVAGLVTFLPSPNHIDAQPNKMFEYMSAGIPVIASDFPLWREIVEGNACGLCVDPLDPKAIAQAIDFVISNPERAEEMGMNGRKAVHEKYNWSFEEKKLLALYEQIGKKDRI